MKKTLQGWLAARSRISSNKATYCAEDTSAAILPAVLEKQNKYHADLAISSIDRRIPIVIEQFSNASKWLTGSLFALNGAGALATLNALPKLNNPTLPAMLFSLGLLFVMMSAVALQEATQRNLSMAEDWRSYWLSVQKWGLRHEEVEADKKSYHHVADKLYYIAPSLGWISGILFFTGIYVLSSSINLRPDIDVSNCVVIKRHILKHRVNRPENISLFQALNCGDLI